MLFARPSSTKTKIACISILKKAMTLSFGSSRVQRTEIHDPVDKAEPSQSG